MARSRNTPAVPATPPGWSAFVQPDEGVRHNTRYRSARTSLVPCGVEWDAVAVVPLERGLSALDVLGLPLDAGHPVLACYLRAEVVVLVAAGAGKAFAEVPGTRVLSTGSFLLVPSSDRGNEAAAWISRGEAYLDAADLFEALLTVDERRVEGRLARLGATAASIDEGARGTTP